MEFQTIDKDSISFPYGSFSFLNSDSSFFVLYFEETINESNEKLINENREKLEKAFKLKNRTFCYLPDFFEHFKTTVIQATNFNAFWDEDEKQTINETIQAFDYKHFYTFFKKSFGILPEIKNGTLNHIGNFAAIPKPDEESVSDFLFNMADEVSFVESTKISFSISAGTIIKTDEELKKEEFIKKMDNLIKDMKGNGVLHILSSYIFETIEENLEHNKINKITTILISKDGEILFPLFKNVTLKLSHLTKTIYIFYLLNKESLAISNLENHKKELIEIYKKISYRNDVDSLENTITELVKGNAEGVYVHISRIKSAVNKIFIKRVAPFYYINGAKNEPKEVLLDKKYIKNQLD